MTEVEKARGVRKPRGGSGRGVGMCVQVTDGGMAPDGRTEKVL